MSQPKNQNRTFHLLQKADILTCYGHVEEIREVPDRETMYWVQLGSDFTTRVWVRESELERAD